MSCLCSSQSGGRKNKRAEEMFAKQILQPLENGVQERPRGGETLHPQVQPELISFFTWHLAVLVSKQCVKVKLSVYPLPGSDL